MPTCPSPPSCSASPRRSCWSSPSRRSAGWTKPRLQGEREDRPDPPMAVQVLAGLAGVFLFGQVVYAGFAGTDEVAENFSPTFVYVVFWVGVPFVSLLFGDVFRHLNPWRAVGRAAGSLVKRAGGEEASEPLPYPDRLGRWPAVAGLALFAAAELCWATATIPTRSRPSRSSTSWPSSWAWGSTGWRRGHAAATRSASTSRSWRRSPRWAAGARRRSTTACRERRRCCWWRSAARCSTAPRRARSSAKPRRGCRTAWSTSG